MTPRSLLIACLVLVVAFRSVESGCYKDKSRKKTIPMEKRFKNFVFAPEVEESHLPRSFNWCDLEGVSYCSPSWNQHLPTYCGSCWLHASLSAINDRIKIMKGAQGQDVMLSRQTLLNCAGFEGFGDGCDGGDPIDVYNYIHKHGLSHEDCMPYSASDHTKWPDATECPVESKCLNCMPVDGHHKCWPVPTPILYNLSSYGQCCNRTTHAGIVSAMMSEIIHRGPITCSMAAGENFVYNYRVGIWEDDGDRDLDHDVEVVGWGEENGKKYWLVRNSWGTYWGELGFFKLERGTNAQGLEGGDCWSAVPDIKMERDVIRHKYWGTMFGIVKANNSDVAAAMSSS